MSTQAKGLNTVPTIDIGPDTPLLGIGADGKVGKGTLQALLGSLRIGGRNLVRNSGAEKIMTEYYTSYTLSEIPTIDEFLIVSVWAELGADRTRITIYNGWGAGSDEGYVNIPKSSFKNGRATAVLHIKKATTAITVFQHPGDGTSQSTIHRIKVERGDIPTDWSPAPEDYNSGGVISCTAIGPYLVAYREKGGRHEHNGEEYGRCASQFGAVASAWTDGRSCDEAGSVGVSESDSMSAECRLEHTHGNGTLSNRDWLISELPIGTSRLHGAGVQIHSCKHCTDSDLWHVGHGYVYPQTEDRCLDSVVSVQNRHAACITPRKEVVAA